MSGEKRTSQGAVMMADQHVVDITELATLREQFPLRLMQLGFRLMQVRDATGRDQHHYVVPPVCAVPAGPFLMGNVSNFDFPEDMPQHTVTLAAFHIGIYPVTVTEYAVAVSAGAVAASASTYAPFAWQTQLQRPDHPVVNVSWFAARTYASWLRQLTGQPWDLPTEAQWEKAARGAEGRSFPWGNVPNQAWANSRESRMAGTTPVGSYPLASASPYGVYDLAGNVSEWTSSLFQDYPYDAKDGREDLQDATQARVHRGGSFGYVDDFIQTTSRGAASPDKEDFTIGFRLVLNAA